MTQQLYISHRHDNTLRPDEISEDVPPEHLAETKSNYSKLHVVVTNEEAAYVEMCTQGQSRTE